MVLLAGDIGGTRTRLALFDGATQLARVELASRPKSDPVEVLRAGFRQLQATVATPVTAAALGVAGPVAQNQCILTNLGWELTPSVLRRAFGAIPVYLHNDLVCAAAATTTLGKGEQLVVKPGQINPRGVRLTIGIGTGLGLATVVPGQLPTVVPAEAGHQGFSPETTRQLDLYRFVADVTRGRVTWEDLLSGPGLTRLHAFVHATTANPDTPAQLSPAQIHAQATTSTTCAAACELLAELAGSFVGQAALVAIARGGVFLTGGVANHLREFLNAPGFTQAMVGKPPMTELLQTLQVSLVTDPGLGLRGAALLAAGRVVVA